MADSKNTVDQKYTGSELIPPKNHPDVGKKCFELWGESVNDKIELGLHDDWNRNKELVRNKHWRNKDGAAVPLVSVNLIHAHIQRTCNTMTDNNPTFNVSRMASNEEVDPAYFEDLGHAVDYWWNDQEQQDVLDTSVHHGEEYGPAIEKVIFNPDLEYGLGEVEAIPVDPFHFAFYPVKLTDARNLQKSEALFHFWPMTVREAKRRWPKFENKIKPDAEVLKDLGGERREIGSEEKKGEGYSTTISSTIKDVFNFLTGKSVSEEGDELLAIECWCKDYTEKKSTTKNGKPAMEDEADDLSEPGEEPGNVFDEVEDETKVTTEPLYPGNIRYIVILNSGKLVVEDRPNPNINPELPQEEAQKTYLYDKYPFSMVVSVKDTSCAWRGTDLDQLKEMNLELDKAISQMILLKDAAVRQPIILPRSCGVSSDDLTNYAQVIEPSNANEAAAIRRLEPPQIPADVINITNLFKEFFFLVAGTFELDQAQQPGKSVIAYKAIAALLERAATMQRGKIRAYSRLIRERGRMFVSHVQNFYTEDRWITYQGPDGKEISKQINGKNLRIPAKLTVVTGSTMPTSRIQQREEAIELYKMQIIDRPAVLDKLDVSDRNDILRRMEMGPVGQAMQKLQAIGVPPQLLQVFTQVIQAEPEKIEKALKAGQLPQFAQIMQQMQAQAQGQPPQQPQVDPATQAEAQLKQAQEQKTMAEIQKIDAERALVIEKINTEKVDQQVKIAGVEFDKEQMEVNRAKTVAEIEKQSQEAGIQRVEMARSIEAQRHSENMDKVGMGKDIAAQRHGQEMEREGLAREDKVQKHTEEMDKANLEVSNQKNRPGWNEKGLKSNNQGEK